MTWTIDKGDFSISSGSGADPASDPNGHGSTGSAGSNPYGYTAPPGGVMNGTPGTIGGGSQSQWQQVVQQVIGGMQMGQSSVTPHVKPKFAHNFSVEFLGFSFPTVSPNGVANVQVLEDAVVAIAKMGRDRTGWKDFAMAFVDDELGSVSKILVQEMEDSILHPSRKFDMCIHYYDTTGMTTTTTDVFECRLMDMEYDQLDLTAQSTPLTLTVMIRPTSVTV